MLSEILLLHTIHVYLTILTKKVLNAKSGSKITFLLPYHNYSGKHSKMFIKKWNLDLISIKSGVTKE